MKKYFWVTLIVGETHIDKFMLRVSEKITQKLLVVMWSLLMWDKSSAMKYKDILFINGNQKKCKRKNQYRLSLNVT